MGILFAVLSGTFIALQGIFNAKLGYAVGAWLSVTVVHLVGLVLALLIYAFKRDADLTAFRRVLGITASAVYSESSSSSGN